jgi:DNA-binding SARP family transcriptional activator
MHDHDSTESLKFSLLGPVRAWRGHTELDLGSPQQRATLAMLLMREGAAVTLREIITGMWGNEPPRSAVTTIRTYVSRLRAVLDRGMAQAVHLDSVGGGYVLRTPDDALDVSRFRRHAAPGSEAARQGDWGMAVAEQRAALDLWHGQPLAGTFGPYVDRESTRLQHLVTAAQVDLATAQLELGHYREVLPELTAMAANHPFYEDIQALFMTALFGSGRTVAALQHYQSARRALVKDLGVEPGSHMCEVHQRILAGDPSLLPAPRRF